MTHARLVELSSIPCVQGVLFSTLAHTVTKILAMAQHRVQAKTSVWICASRAQSLGTVCGMILHGSKLVSVLA